MPIIKKYSQKYKIDPRELIIAVCNIDSQATEIVTEKEAKK